MEIVDRHIAFDKEVYNLIKKKSKGRFNTTASAVNYYLRKGLEVEGYEDIETVLKSEMNVVSKDIKFLKKLIIQMFVNKGFATNRKIKDDEAYNDFINSLNKDKLVD